MAAPIALNAQAKLTIQKEFTATGSFGPYDVVLATQTRVVVENVGGSNSIDVKGRIKGQTSYTTLSTIVGASAGTTIDTSVVDELLFTVTTYSASGGTPKVIASGFFKQASSGGGGGSGDVVGPASSANNSVAIFDGLTGKLLKDTGLAVTNVATLASPAFTGTPTAPTQSAGNNSTRLATTAYVDAAAGVVSAASQPLDGDLTAIAALATTGFSTRTSANTWALRTDTAGVGVAISNGDGVAGNPTFALSSNAQIKNFGISIDGSGSAITTGVKGYLTIPFACTITGWTLLGDVSGSIVIDVWKDTYANYPPTVADTITGASKPTISAALKGQNLSVSGWTTSVSAGDTIGFNVDSASTLTKATLVIQAVLT